MAKKIKLRQCFVCWEGYGCKREKLPRKKKKALKKLYAAFPRSLNYGYFDGVTSCSLESHYKHWKKAIQKLPYLLKYKSEIQFLIRITGNYDFGDAPILVNEDGRLCWHWEYDNDYGGDEGLMPFCYNEESAGNTWAFEEVESILRRLWVHQDYDNRNWNDYVYPVEVTSDATLLKYIKQFVL